MGLDYLMDSNVIIEYTGKKFTGSAERALDAAFNGNFYYSIVTRIEVLGFQGTAAVLQGLQDFLDLSHQYGVTDAIANQTILIRRAFPKIKTPDALIAASALLHNHTLLSRNTDDFKKVPGLKVIDPHTL